MGVVTGTPCQLAAATLGLSPLLFSSPRTLQLVKQVGAGYIVYLGIPRRRQAERNVAGGVFDCTWPGLCFSRSKNQIRRMFLGERNSRKRLCCFLIGPDV
jgi:hypothetical protein